MGSDVWQSYELLMWQETARYSVKEEESKQGGEKRTATLFHTTITCTIPSAVEHFLNSLLAICTLLHMQHL